MFVTRPAVSEICVAFLDTRVPPGDMRWNEEEAVLSGTVKNANGVTMGQLRETEWIDKEIERRSARGISTRIRLSVHAYEMWSVEPVLLLVSSTLKRLTC